MIRIGVPRTEADDLVVMGGRVLQHYRNAEGNPICDVETEEEAPVVESAEEEPRPKKRKKAGQEA